MYRAPRHEHTVALVFLAQLIQRVVVRNQPTKRLSLSLSLSLSPLLHTLLLSQHYFLTVSSLAEERKNGVDGVHGGCAQFLTSRRRPPVWLCQLYVILERHLQSHTNALVSRSDLLVGGAETRKGILAGRRLGQKSGSIVAYRKRERSENKKKKHAWKKKKHALKKKNL